MSLKTEFFPKISVGTLVVFVFTGLASSASDDVAFSCPKISLPICLIREVPFLLHCLKGGSSGLKAGEDESEQSEDEQKTIDELNVLKKKI